VRTGVRACALAQTHVHTPMLCLCLALAQVKAEAEVKRKEEEAVKQKAAAESKVTTPHPALLERPESTHAHMPVYIHAARAWVYTRMRSNTRRYSPSLSPISPSLKHTVISQSMRDYIHIILTHCFCGTLTKCLTRFVLPEIHTYRYIHTYIYADTYLPTYLPTYIHTYIHTYIYMDTSYL